jgi:hypothetical protein
MAINTRRTIVELSVLGSLIYIGLNFQSIADQVALRTFQPSTQLAPIIDQLELTPHAKAVLYRMHPQIDDKAAFNQHCSPAVGALELGCFDGRHIYVLNITNQSLAPEMTVVLAHELLHAVWVRESAAQHDSLTAQLNVIYTRLHDQDLTARMVEYSKSEPGQQGNELHSILATEYASLSPELETYYAQTFTDRSLIVKAHAAYQDVFDARRRELSLELQQINGFKSQLVGIDSQMNSYKAHGNIPGYNSLVPRQNSLVQQTNALISVYQRGVDEYNALSTTLQSAPLPAAPATE